MIRKGDFLERRYLNLKEQRKKSGNDDQRFYTVSRLPKTSRVHPSDLQGEILLRAGCCKA